MATSPARKARRKNSRRRKAAGLVAAGAASALLAGTLTPPAPAEAASIIETLGGCLAGGANVGTSDCSEADKSIIAELGDGIIQLIAPDALPFKLSDLNGAAGIFGGTAKIKGSGFNTAIGGLGDATANADLWLSGAISLGILGNAHSSALFGLAAAVGALGGTANADALPGGVAIASIVGMPDGTANSTALGGITAAIANVADPKAVCTALYGTASVTDDGDNVSSCTSVLFIFQQSQEGDDPVVYAIKNPLDIQLTGLMPEQVAAPILQILEALQAPAALGDILVGNFIPYFGSDIVNIQFVDGVPRSEPESRNGWSACSGTWAARPSRVPRRSASSPISSVSAAADPAADSVISSEVWLTAHLMPSRSWPPTVNRWRALCSLWSPARAIPPRRMLAALRQPRLRPSPSSQTRTQAPTAA